VIWYTAVRKITATAAATAQLSVPVITPLVSSVFMGEQFTLTLLIASAAVLAGVALVIFDQ
jgi:drug/metabolite transporter (DMT)-like permease